MHLSTETGTAQYLCRGWQQWLSAVSCSICISKLSRKHQCTCQEWWLSQATYDCTAAVEGRLISFWHHYQFRAVSGKAASAHHTVFWWMVAFNSRNETEHMWVSPAQPAAAYMLAMLQCVPRIMGDRTFDELQHETCPCHATVPVIVHQDVKTECAHQVSWDLMPEKRCGCKHVSCHNSWWTLWQFLCQAVNIFI